MIQNFRDADTAEFFVKRSNARWGNLKKVALRKLDQMKASLKLNDLKTLPGYRLESLKRDRAGRHSIGINDQYRICFVWKLDGAHEVEITDYH